MPANIFLLQDGSNLVKMHEALYDSEALLQQLLAQYPDLLAGDQINSAEPRRFILIRQEMAVPDEEDGAGRWSLDHLFVDQDGIPTLIEAKRSTDTRIRREVVGQMLDYAANAVEYWPVAAIRAEFQSACSQRGDGAAKLIESFVGPGSSVEEFWQRVKTNLDAGRIRMIFVADEVPRELQRIVEFLNGQMDPAEVLAVEIKQFVGEGLKTLVPRVIGQTIEAERKKGVRTEKKQWDEASFLEDLQQRRPEAEVNAVRRILEWTKQSVPRIWWGQGSKDGSFYPVLDFREVGHIVIAVWTYGRVEVQFQRMRAPFEDAKRLELRDKLNRIPGIDIPPDGIKRRPSFPLAALTTDAALTEFLAVLDWYIAEVKSTS